MDSLSIGLLKDTLDVRMPHLIEIISASFTSEIFPEEFKTALVRPPLKKPTLNKDIYKNYTGLVSSLAFIGKLTKKVALSRLLAHMKINGLEGEHQSACRQFHSTQTTLLKVQDNVARALGAARPPLCCILTS